MESVRQGKFALFVLRKRGRLFRTKTQLMLQAMRALIIIFALLIALTHETWGQNSGTLAVAGVITLVDTNRSLLVIQDREQARAIKLPSVPSELLVGQRVVIEGKAAPYSSACTDYPNYPSGRGVLPSLETPADWDDHFLARLRGFLPDKS